MEKGISDFKYLDTFDYIDDELFFISETKAIPDELMNECLDFELSVFCIQGRMQLTLLGSGEGMDTRTVTLQAGQHLLCPEFMPMTDFMASPDIRLSVMGYSWNILEDAPGLDKNAWRVTDFVTSNPVMTLTEEQHSCIRQYLDIISRHALTQPEPRFAKEIIQLEYQAMIYEFLGFVMSHIDDTEVELSQEVSQGVLLSRSFFDILARGQGRIRSVAEVAQWLNITPKYLSRVISSNSGHPPIYYIHQYTVKAIERELRYSEKTIKQIASDLGFPSLAFFGKFTKEHLGVSPSEYRTRLAEE